MACHGARRLLEMAENLAGIIGIEALCAAQGVELRAPLKTSKSLVGYIATIRAVSPALADDRLIALDIEAVRNLIRDGVLAPVNSPEL